MLLLWCDNAELIIYSRFTLSPVFLEAAVQQLVWKKEAGWRSKQIWFFHLQYCWYSQRDTTHGHCFDHGSNTSWQTRQVPSDIPVPLETKSSTSKFGTKMWFVPPGNQSHRKMISIYLGEVWPIQSADRGLRFHIYTSNYHITQNLSSVSPCSSQEGREEATAEAPTCACIVCGFNTGALEKIQDLMCSFGVGWWTLNKWWFQARFVLMFIPLCHSFGLEPLMQDAADASVPRGKAGPEHLQVLANSMDNIQGIGISTGLLITYIYNVESSTIGGRNNYQSFRAYYSMIFDISAALVRNAVCFTR